MLTTDQSLTLQGLLRIMSAEDVLLFLSNRLAIKADSDAQDGRFKDEKAHLQECYIIEDAISKIREYHRHHNTKSDYIED